MNLDEVIADLKLGIKSKAIQEKYGLSKTAVYRIRNGLSLTGSRRDLVLRMARNGSTVSEISERFHCFTAAIKEVLNVDH